MTYRIQLAFTLNEDVSPEHLARWVAEACAKYNALREGESVSTTAPVPIVYTISNEATPSPFA